MAAPITAVMHSNSHGQSLSIGATPKGGAAYTTKPLDGNIMFATGPRYTGKEALDAFAPLIERMQGQLCETGIAVSLAHTVTLMEREGGLAPADRHAVFLGSASGVVGYPLMRLNKGTAPYHNLLALAMAANELCRSQGKSYVYTDTMWTQGEADQLSGVPRDKHKSRVLQLASDLTTDIKAISSQVADPLMITYQPASHLFYHNRSTSPRGPATPNIAMALRDAALASDIRIACPMYMMEYVDGVHLPSNWYQVLGAYYGRLRKRLLDDRRVGRPLGLHRLDVKSVTWNGTVIDVTLDVPSPPIAIDTELVAETANYGFDLWDGSGGLLDIITDVAVVGPDQIRITCSSEPPSGAALTAGWGRPTDSASSGRLYGPRCNIRDSEGLVDTITDGLGAVRPLHNWLVLFDVIKSESGG